MTAQILVLGHTHFRSLKLSCLLILTKGLEITGLVWSVYPTTTSFLLRLFVMYHTTRLVFIGFAVYQFLE